MDVLKGLAGLLPTMLSIASALICQWYYNCNTVRYDIGTNGYNIEQHPIIIADERGSITEMKYRLEIKGSEFLNPNLKPTNIPNNINQDSVVDPWGRYYTTVAVLLVFSPEKEDLGTISMLNREELGNDPSPADLGLYSILERVVDARFVSPSGYDYTVFFIINL